MERQNKKWKAPPVGTLHAACDHPPHISLSLTVSQASPMPYVHSLIHVMAILGWVFASKESGDSRRVVIRGASSDSVGSQAADSGCLLPRLDPAHTSGKY